MKKGASFICSGLVSVILQSCGCGDYCDDMDEQQRRINEPGPLHAPRSLSETLECEDWFTVTGEQVAVSFAIGFFGDKPLACRQTAPDDADTYDRVVVENDDGSPVTYRQACVVPVAHSLWSIRMSYTVGAAQVQAELLDPEAIVVESREMFCEGVGY